MVEFLTSLPPIDWVVLATIFGIYVVVTLSPGPNFALVSRLAMQGRRDAAMGASAAIASGATLYAILSMVGLAIILNEISWLVRFVQIGGGLYLIYLGIKGWLIHSVSDDNTTNMSGKRGHGDFRSGFRIGLIVELSNPKGIAFYVGLYAVAIPVDATISTRIALLVGGFILEFGWYAIVAQLMSRGWIRRAYKKYVLWIERFVGTVLILFGARMVADR